jgi:hypothetical protein
MSEIGNPMSNTMITSRNAHEGSSHAGKTADASWIVPPRHTHEAAATR